MPTNSVRELKAQYPGAKVRKLANNTYSVVDDRCDRVVLHRTEVVTLDRLTGWEVWRTGGYKSATTKDRINRFAVNGRVFQKNFQWYVTTKRGTFLFDYDRVQVTPTGYVYNMDAIYPLVSIEDAKASINATKGFTK